MSPTRRQVITGPDLDRLASGLHAPEIAELRRKVEQSSAANVRLRRNIKDLNKRVKAAENEAKSLREALATSRETRGKYARENAILRSRLLNLGVTIPESAEANDRIEIYRPDGTPKTVDEIRAEAAAMRGEE